MTENLKIAPKGYLGKNEEVWRFSKHISHPENEDMAHGLVRTECHSSILRVINTSLSTTVVSEDRVPFLNSSGF